MYFSSWKSKKACETRPNDARLLATTLHAAGFNLVGEGARLDLDKRGFERAIEAFGGELSAGESRWSCCPTTSIE
jgi:hypothetical protein